MRVGLRTLIAAEHDLVVVGEAATGDEALARIGCLLPDVAIVDLHLSQGSGASVWREVRSRYPGVKCLVLTAFADARDACAAIKAGCSYVLKQQANQDVVEAIRKVAQGRTVLDPGMTERVLARFASDESGDVLSRLSTQERRILERLGRGMTNRQIATELALAEKTVRNYMSNLLAKLGMHRRSEAAAFAARLEERGEFARGL